MQHYATPQILQDFVPAPRPKRFWTQTGNEPITANDKLLLRPHGSELCDYYFIPQLWHNRPWYELHDAIGKDLHQQGIFIAMIRPIT